MTSDDSSSGGFFEGAGVGGSPERGGGSFKRPDLAGIKQRATELKDAMVDKGRRIGGQAREAMTTFRSRAENAAREIDFRGQVLEEDIANSKLADLLRNPKFQKIADIAWTGAKLAITVSNPAIGLIVAMTDFGLRTGVRFIATVTEHGYDDGVDWAGVRAELTKDYRFVADIFKSDERNLKNIDKEKAWASGIGILAGAAIAMVGAQAGDALFGDVGGGFVSEPVRKVAASLGQGFVMHELARVPKLAEILTRDPEKNQRIATWLNRTVRATAVTLSTVGYLKMGESLMHTAAAIAGVDSPAPEPTPTMQPDATSQPSETAMVLTVIAEPSATDVPDATATVTSEPTVTPLPTDVPTEVPTATHTPTESPPTATPDVWQLGEMPTEEQYRNGDILSDVYENGVEHIATDLDGDGDPDILIRLYSNPSGDGVAADRWVEVVENYEGTGHSLFSFDRDGDGIADQFGMDTDDNHRIDQFFNPADVAEGSGGTAKMANVIAESRLVPPQPSGFDMTGDGVPDLVREGDATWLLDTDGNGFIDEGDRAVSLENFHYDTTNHVWDFDRILSIDGQQEYVFIAADQVWETVPVETVAPDVVTDSSTETTTDVDTTNDTTAEPEEEISDTETTESRVVGTPEELQAARDESGRPTYYVRPDGSATNLVYGPEGGPIGLVQEVLAGNPDLNGNQVGDVGFDIGSEIVQLVENNGGSATVYPGESLEDFMVRNNVPAVDIAAILDKVNAIAGK